MGAGCCKEEEIDFDAEGKVFKYTLNSLITFYHDNRTNLNY